MNPLLFPVITKIIDIIGGYFPNEEEKNKAKLELINAEQQGRLEDVRAQLSAIITEAQSPDPWTSRSRPSFLYVIYICILMSIPMGVVSAIKPEIAVAVANGFASWLNAIPESLYALFGAGYLGYTGARTWEKGKGLNK